MSARPSYVYFIKPVGRDGPIKIGRSFSPKERLESLTVWSPWPLEIIGSVQGHAEDERFLHECFCDHHSHREWFHSSPELRAEIDRVISEDSFSGVRTRLSRKGTIRSEATRRKSPEFRLRMSYVHRIRFTQQRLRSRQGKKWYAPDFVREIMEKWSGLGPFSPGGPKDPDEPSQFELKRLDAYLSDPEKCSVRPSWEKDAA